MWKPTRGWPKPSILRPRCSTCFFRVFLQKTWTRESGHWESLMIGSQWCCFGIIDPRRDPSTAIGLPRNGQGWCHGGQCRHIWHTWSVWGLYIKCLASIIPREIGRDLGCLPWSGLVVLEWSCSARLESRRVKVNQK